MIKYLNFPHQRFVTKMFNVVVPLPYWKKYILFLGTHKIRRKSKFEDNNASICKIRSQFPTTQSIFRLNTERKRKESTLKEIWSKNMSNKFNKSIEENQDMIFKFSGHFKGFYKKVRYK